MANKINFEFTDPEKIRASVDETIKAFDTARANLNQAAIKYTEDYDEYNNHNLYDGTLLRERMKLAVIKSTTDNELQ